MLIRHGVVTSELHAERLPVVTGRRQNTRDSGLQDVGVELLLGNGDRGTDGRGNEDAG